MTTTPTLDAQVLATSGIDRSASGGGKRHGFDIAVLTKCALFGFIYAAILGGVAWSTADWVLGEDLELVAIPIYVALITFVMTWGASRIVGPGGNTAMNATASVASATEVNAISESDKKIVGDILDILRKRI